MGAEASPASGSTAKIFQFCENYSTKKNKKYLKRTPYSGSAAKILNLCKKIPKC